MTRKIIEVLDFQDAMDNLATIAEIDMEHPPLLGMVKGNSLVTDAEEFPMGTVQWLSGEGEGPILEILDKTYRAIYQHLLSLYESVNTDWENEKLKKGTQAMMTLALESAEKMDRYLAFRIEKPLPKITLSEVFKTLQQFFLYSIQPKFGENLEGEEAWGEEWKENKEAPSSTASGLKDFETVKRDKEYELFYIRDADGNPYFSKDLLRNIKLSVDLQAVPQTFEEDPFLKIRAMQDRDLNASASQIIGDAIGVIDDYLHIAKKLENNDLAKEINQALFALFLAANPQNLLGNTFAKSAQQYFLDFQVFLRSSVNTKEYQKAIAYGTEDDKVLTLLMQLTHTLAYAFFRRVGGIKQEVIGLIHRTMRKGEEKDASKKKLSKEESVWNAFLQGDERIRTFFLQFPNGPLFKILDLIREEEEENIQIPFDPIVQGNLPSSIYKIKHKEKEMIVMRIPSPIRQTTIQKGEITEGFKGFLRALSYKKNKHLLINMNDRTSWREFARCQLLENLEKNAEFSQQFIVITLPKDTDFYFQNNEYLNLNKASDFIAAFLEQIESGGSCGYFFPASWKKEDILDFAKETLAKIHTDFFQMKETLPRRAREDFIEIFYQFLVAKAIDQVKPDSLSFTCKDAIDTGAAAAATFYGFLKILDGEDMAEKEEFDFLLWLFYAPALFIRERAIDPERLHRSLSVLERIESAEYQPKWQLKASYF